MTDLDDVNQPDPRCVNCGELEDDCECDEGFEADEADDNYDEDDEAFLDEDDYDEDDDENDEDEDD